MIENTDPVNNPDLVKYLIGAILAGFSALAAFTAWLVKKILDLWKENVTVLTEVRDAINSVISVLKG